MKKLLLVLLSTLLISSALSNANAATQEKGWRYWGYFQAAPGASSWTYAQTGAAGSIPKDGAVEGWRFSFSSDTVDTGFPVLKPNFKATCSGVAPVAGKNRVAVVIDFGPRAIAPKGEQVQQTIRKCVLIKSGATGMDALAAATSIRTSSSGFVCGLNNYPAKECSTEILTPKSLKK